MKLEIFDAVPLLLALPAHRSNNEGHRILGEKALDFLFQYNDLGIDNVEKAYNRNMISAILSSVRAFSIERDRLSDNWKSLELIKGKRETFITDLRELSPLSRGNSWVKSIVTILSVFGIGLERLVNNDTTNVIAFIGYLLLALLLIEVVTIIIAWLITYNQEKKFPSDKKSEWEKQSMARYKDIVSHFITEAIAIYKRYFPNETKIGGYDIENEGTIKLLIEDVINRSFYL